MREPHDERHRAKECGMQARHGGADDRRPARLHPVQDIRFETHVRQLICHQNATE